MTTLVVAAFAAALLGSAHCAAMCGAIACAAADVDVRRGGRFRAAVAYHGARLAGYVTLGAIAGAAGAGLDTVFSVRAMARPAAFAAGAVLVLWGIARVLPLVGVRSPRVNAAAAAGRRLASPVLRGLAHRPPLVRATLLGAVAPLLPCGWLYAFVASAASTGSAPEGALVMAGFWAGTVPALAAVTVGLARLLGPARRFVPALTAVALIVVGSLTMARAVDASPPAVHQHTAP